VVRIFVVCCRFVSQLTVSKKKRVKISDIFYYRKLNESLVWKDVSGWAAREIAEQNQMWSWCEFWCPVVDSPCSPAASQVNKTKQTNGIILGVDH
jgi:hypothetical protein